MAVARLTTVLVGAAVIGLTFVMQTAQGKNDLFDVTNKMFGVFLPPIAIPMMLGLVTRRISRRGGVVRPGRFAYRSSGAGSRRRPGHSRP